MFVLEHNPKSTKGCDTRKGTTRTQPIKMNSSRDNGVSQDDRNYGNNTGTTARRRLAFSAAPALMTSLPTIATHYDLVPASLKKSSSSSEETEQVRFMVDGQVITIDRAALKGFDVFEAMFNPQMKEGRYV